MTTASSAKPAAQSLEQRGKKPLRLQSVPRTGVAKSAKTQIWYDLRKVHADLLPGIIQRLPNLQYTGVVMASEHLALLSCTPPALRIVYAATSVDEVDAYRAAQQSPRGEPAVVLSQLPEVLTHAHDLGLSTCLYQYVDDEASLHRSIHLGKNYPHLMIHFRDPTNIPLELVIASLQATQTVLLKEITDTANIDDAIVSLGVMEVGADGVVYSPTSHAGLDAFAKRLQDAHRADVGLEPATVVESRPIGMGFRSCLDLVTLFSDTEGMLVGSTSQGGILCCPEVFYLPYMEKRPFRVNAGAVHSYVYNAGNRTDYMSELKAGSQVLVVGLDGSSRTAAIGRSKTEMRPLRLIVAKFATGETINVILQDDWHVRVFSADGEPLNVTELKAGDTLLAHKARPGRHVGIEVEERIVEN